MAAPPNTVARRASDQAGGAAVVADGLRATPQNSSTSGGRRRDRPGRHREHDTTPGSSRSSPSKKPAICAGLRRITGGVPNLFHCATASSGRAVNTLVEW